ncbi:hypothetical protein FOXG_11880 [Fusarium oxysporum f. sp. lycopersici 4287]|uniref:Uncharacterized protein n=3 Tax=Fusarium oxysporum TaxID=5507 RepID=A0A0J9VMN1_FUSO4|nr:hypothetical protein FOXG_11880 [Fusarium oxysporum f. sp. lycopersici 4287]EXK29547.1 hypothetical protein FOMG_14020 [Fusarium oxysporum f. sp. melonis 26406]KAJ9418938.1 hypothetical protein QL093DRAFT_2119341 [Fusarium oxysporum]KNB12253.1 hypothetical protein FOXG_11880 [Fusarium oxysporum f. sp. lycopersici 4287]
MAELTVGYVAGIIAFGIVIAQLFCPTAITLIIAGQLRDRETAGTWTTAGRVLQSSLWPTLLRADSTQQKGVRTSISLMTSMVPLLALLISLAGVITPLGLYEQDENASESISATFQYVKDTSTFLQGTSPRDNKTFTRTCNYSPMCLAPCPYTSDVTIISSDGLQSNCSILYGTNTTVPNILHDIYMSGTKKRRTTISNYFDIEWRQITAQYNKNYNNGTPIAVGVFRPLESFALREDIRPVEGLIVDSENGGVGLRNHTLPVGHTQGATWTEDLLFLEPETECVNLNVSIDFEISTSSKSSSGIAVTKLFMTDHGGLVHINKTNPEHDAENNGNKPDLKTRAYQAAWYTNGINMLFMNISDPTDKIKGVKAFDRIDSKIGKKWKLPITEIYHTNYQSLEFFNEFGNMMGVDKLSSNFSKTEQIYDNPYKITAADYDAAKFICQATTLNAPPKLNNTYVSCSLVRGVPNRVDDGPPNLFEDGSKWSSPLYTCASAVKATIKAVTFFHNGTSDSVERLTIKEVKEKEYKNVDDMPLWGVEDSSLGLAQFQPIWGIVDPAFKDLRNISTLRAPSLYMLGSSQENLFGTSGFNPGFSEMNIPGSIVPISALATIVNSRDSSEPVIDFTAQRSMSLWLKWKRLSSSEDSMPMVFKLLWNDLAASALVGSKGVLGARNEDPDQAARVEVIPSVRKIKYHWVFGIPAFILILVIGLITIGVTAMAVVGKSSPDLLRHRLKQVSIGRLLTSVFHTDSSSLIMSPSAWSKDNGNKHIDMAGACPIPGGPPVTIVNHQSQPFNAPPEQFYQAQGYPLQAFTKV